MRFEWDERKNTENLRKHGLDFRDVRSVFKNETYTEIADRFDYGEVRYYTIGLLKGMTVVISHTETTEEMRIVSFRKAEKYEEELYFKTIRD